MLSQKAVELARKKLAAPIVFASKKGGRLRFFVDYCELKLLKTREFYLSSPCIVSLSHAYIFFILNVKSGYWNGRL